MSSSAGLTITAQSNNRWALINLIADDSGNQTWNQATGLLDAGATSGVWRLGGAQGKNRILALFGGSDYSYSSLVISLNNVPPQFIGAFCVEYTGDGNLISNGAVVDDLTYALDVNPCM